MQTAANRLTSKLILIALKLYPVVRIEANDFFLKAGVYLNFSLSHLFI